MYRLQNLTKLYYYDTIYLMITNAGAAVIAAKANEIPAAIEHIIAGIEEGELETNKNMMLRGMDLIVDELFRRAGYGF